MTHPPLTTAANAERSPRPSNQTQTGNNGVRSTSISQSASRNISPVRSTRSFHPEASLVLVGIRGSGKRSLGLIAAAALGRRLVTEDHFFHEITGHSRQEYLKQHGNREFHRQEIETSRRMLDENQRGCVIECGLGSLTTGVQEHLRIYATTNPVVYLVRDMAHIQRLLKLDDRSTRLLANGDPTHRRCSSFEFFNLEDNSMGDYGEDKPTDRWSPSYSFKLKQSKEDFTYFVRQITGTATLRNNATSPFSLYGTPVEQRLYTHSLVIRLSELQNHQDDLGKFESAGDAIELLVDRWSNSEQSNLAKGVALLRRHVGVPIIITAMNGPLLDLGPSLSPEDAYLNIVEHGFRLGAEFVSVNLPMPEKLVRRLAQCKGFTKLIGHHLDMSPTVPNWDHQIWLNHVDFAEAVGCDAVRLLKTSLDRSDNLVVQVFADKVRRGGSSLPLIAYNVGDVGRTSQLYNQILTPVTHPSLRGNGSIGYEGTIISKAAIKALFQSFVLDPLQFYIFGANVLYSLSPAMHNAAYRACGLGHQYMTKNVESLSEIASNAQSPSFGGASIVRPYKVAIMDQLASKSRHAEVIGAVNTLLPLRAGPDGKVMSLKDQASQRNRAGRILAWYGDNTDWIGIKEVLERSLSPRNVVRPGKTTGLVIGAGGMAQAAVYALLQLGCRKIFIYNRTPSNADKVAQRFNKWANSTENEPTVTVLPSVQEPWPETQLPPTMIVSCVPAHSIDGQPEANFEMPRQWLGSQSGGVIIELAYKPLNTPLLKQMRRFRQETGLSWVIIDGLETLPEQAIAQFELFTGRKAPRSLMRLECLRNYKGEEGQYDENAIKARLRSIYP